MSTLARSIPIRADAQADPVQGNRYLFRGCTAADSAPLATLYFAAYDPGIACSSLKEAAEDVAATFAGEYGSLLTDASQVAVTLDGDLAAAVLVVEKAPWEDTPDCPFIIELFTAREHRRRGLAAALLVKASEVLVRSGHSQIALRVAHDNASATHLYRGLGFSDWTDTEKGPHRTGSNAVVEDSAPTDTVAVERLLRSLPEWFGIESAIADYVEAAGHMDTFFAWPQDDDQRYGPIGALLLQRHFPTAAEIYLMAVDRRWHRQGVGRQLIEKVEQTLKAEGTALHC